MGGEGGAHGGRPPLDDLARAQGVGPVGDVADLRISGLTVSEADVFRNVLARHAEEDMVRGYRAGAEAAVATLEACAAEVTGPPEALPALREFVAMVASAIREASNEVTTRQP